jgi:hypothetical protein
MAEDYLSNYAATGAEVDEALQKANSALQPESVADTPASGDDDVPVSSNWAHGHAANNQAHGISAFGASLVDDPDAASARTTLGLNTGATSAASELLSRPNHSGEQAISTVAGLQAALDGKSPSGHIHSELPSADQKAALNAAENPSGANPFLTASQAGSLGGGDMNAATYDPGNVAANAFARPNHSGEQAISTVTGLQAALDAKSNSGHTHGELPSADQKAALDGANEPGAGNPFATIDDLPAGGGSGDMTAAIYDPGNVAANAFARPNHSGEQAISTVTGLQAALNVKLEATAFNTLAKINALVGDATLVDADSPNVWSGQQTFTETKETVHDLTGTVIDPANGTIQVKTLSAPATFTESLEAGQSILLRLVGADTHTVTWPTTKWYGGKPEDFGADLTGDDTFSCWKDGAAFCAAYIGGYTA